MLGSRNETEQIHKVPPPFAFVLPLKKSKSLSTRRDFFALFMVWKPKVKDPQRRSVSTPCLPGLQGAGSGPLMQVLGDQPC